MDYKKLFDCSNLLKSLHAGMKESSGDANRVVLWNDSELPLQTQFGLPDSTRKYVESVCDTDNALVDMNTIPNCKQQVDTLQAQGYLERDFHDRVLLLTAKLQDQISELTSDLTINRQVIHTTEDYQKVRDLWDQFHVDPMSSFAWNFSWWKAFSTQGRLHLMKFERNGKTIGFAPFYIDRWFGLERLRFLATGNACTDYVDIVCDPKHYELCAFSLAEYIAEKAFDTVELECTKDDRLAVLMKLHLDSVYRFDHRVAEPTWQLRLPDSWEGFRQNAKKSLRRKINKAERNLGSPDFCFSSTSAGLDISRAFEILKNLHMKRWSSLGKKGVFADPKFEEFLRTAVHELNTSSQCEISVVSQHGNPIGSQLYFDAGDGFQLYQSGYCPTAMKTEPGHMLFTNIVKQAINRGDDCFDFLRGNELYKAFWGAEAHSQNKLRMVAKRTLPFLVANTVATVRNLVRPNGFGETKAELPVT